MFSKKNTLVSLFVTCFILILGIMINLSRLNVADLTEKEACPACFGMSMCPDIHQINLDFMDFYSIFNNLFGIKNVYYGNYKNERVVLKKLATKSELAAFDEMISFHEKTVNYNALIMAELNNSNITDLNVKMRLCPSVEKINNLLENVKDSGNDGDYLKYLWTIFKINPEPIMLQILNAINSWPTPRYFGACGRLIIQEYIGPPLSAFNAGPWIKRAKIASSLLDAAYLFTFKDKDFAFYPTDISMDNIAVNKKDEAIFIDLENVIIVDKNPSTEVASKLDLWNEIYTNDVEIDCQDCLVFSTSDICEHRVSDHNYYAICQLFQPQHLSTAVHSNGFLHDPPTYILAKYPMLTQLQKQCSMPEKPYTRIDSGIELKRLLDTIVQDANNYRL